MTYGHCWRLSGGAARGSGMEGTAAELPAGRCPPLPPSRTSVKISAFCSGYLTPSPGDGTEGTRAGPRVVTAVPGIGLIGCPGLAAHEGMPLSALLPKLHSCSQRRPLCPPCLTRGLFCAVNFGHHSGVTFLLPYLTKRLNVTCRLRRALTPNKKQITQLRDFPLNVSRRRCSGAIRAPWLHDSPSRTESSAALLPHRCRPPLPETRTAGLRGYRPHPGPTVPAGGGGGARPGGKLLPRAGGAGGPTSP